MQKDDLAGLTSFSAAQLVRIRTWIGCLALLRSSSVEFFQTHTPEH